MQGIIWGESDFAVTMQSWSFCKSSAVPLYHIKVLVYTHTLIKASLRAMIGESDSDFSNSSTNTSHFLLALSFQSLRPVGERNEDTLWSVILNIWERQVQGKYRVLPRLLWRHRGGCDSGVINHIKASMLHLLKITGICSPKGLTCKSKCLKYTGENTELHTQMYKVWVSLTYWTRPSP